MWGRTGQVMRGGSWNNNQDNARCANRNRNHPHNRNNNIGFRVAESVCRVGQKCGRSRQYDAPPRPAGRVTGSIPTALYGPVE
jgi:hypothetical protein